jgi:hypothetical protein
MRAPELVPKRAAWPIAAALAFVLAGGLPGLSSAEGSGASQIIAMRKAHFGELDKAVRSIRNELRRHAPDFAQISDRAQIIESLSRQLP